MRVVILSDTHASAFALLPDRLQEDIVSADAVLHAGDIGSELFFQELWGKSKEFYAVKGNNDYFDLPDKIVIELESLKIGMTHGHKAGWAPVLNHLSYSFADDKPKVIVYGHTHRPSLDTAEDLTIINPGSPLFNRHVTFNSYVIMDIEKGNFSLDFIKFDRYRNYSV